MALYKLFSSNVEVQYKSPLLSKAMLFTLFTTLLTIILPFIVAYRSRGFWLKSANFIEEPLVKFTYEYLLLVETDDPSQPIICGDMPTLDSYLYNEEYCAEFQVDESRDENNNQVLQFKYNVNIPSDQTPVAVTAVFGLDFKLESVCPLQMQTMAIFERDFTAPVRSILCRGDLQLYQIRDLPCQRHKTDIRYNTSVFDVQDDGSQNIVETILTNYSKREVSTNLKTIISRVYYGNTGAMEIDLTVRIPESKVHYKPSILQELKWAWPQYLSLAFIFYWIFNKIKQFVFNNRLLMAWRVPPTHCKENK